MTNRSRQRIWIEIIITTGIAAAALALASGPAAGWLKPVKPWIIPAVFLYAPVIAVALTDRDFARAGLGAPDRGRAALDLALFAFAILPAFLAGWYVVTTGIFHMRLEPRVPDKLIGLIVWQVAGVALPEEMFFRGWLQPRLDSVIGSKRSFMGARVGPGLFLAAAVFAAMHYLTLPSPIRLLVFFPGMLFGYYRERSDSILVPVLAHAAGNLAFLMLQGFTGG